MVVIKDAQQEKKEASHTEAKIRALRRGLRMGKFRHWLPGWRNWIENGELFGREGLERTLGLAEEADIWRYGLGR